MSACNGASLKKMQFNGQKVKKWNHNGVRVFSAGNIVTYQVDSGTSYQEEVDCEASCLSPTTFTPKKSGWTFVGWREDTAASSEVLSSKVMGDEPITLYAVFRQTVTVTYYNASTTKQTTTGYRYYNNGNNTYPSFKLYQTAISGWTARGWSTGTAGNAGVTYNNATAFTRTSSVTLYGMYQQTITLSYNGNGSTSGSTAAQTGIRYYNSNGNVENPSFVLRANGFARAGWNFTHWLLNYATACAVGETVTLEANAVCYAAWTTQVHYVFNGGAVDSITWLYQLNSGHYGSLVTGSVSFDDEGDGKDECNTYTLSISDYIRLLVAADEFGSSGVIRTESPIDVSNFNRCDIVWGATSDYGGYTGTDRFTDLCWGGSCDGRTYGNIAVPSGYLRKYHYELPDTLSLSVSTLDISALSALYLGVYNAVENNGAYIDTYIQSIRLYNV